MKIIISSDSFKETLTSQEVNNILEGAVLKIFPEAQIVKVQIADGGEGTVDSILSIVTGESFLSEVMGPLPGMKVTAKWGIINEGRDAIIESASVIGLSLLDENHRNPRLTTSYGIGELIRIVMNHNVEKIYLGLGGTSTNDGGAGIALALGAGMYDKQNNPIGLGGEKLAELKKIDLLNIDLRLRTVKIICLCDVENPICGMHGSSYIFAPQKGASHNDVVLLNEALYNFVKVIKNDFGIDIQDLRCGGAAGGISGGMRALFNAELKDGIKTILELIGYRNQIADADLIITGEGKIDSQTVFGKVIKGISDMAKEKKISVMAFCGIMEGNKKELMTKLSLSDIFPVVNQKISKEQSLENPSEHLYQTCIEGLKNFKNLRSGL